MSTEKKEVAVAPKQETNIVKSVLDKINIFRETGELRLPPNYSPENALKAAMLILAETKDKNGKLVMESCTKESIANALLKMVVLGANPLKKQVDFIAYDGKLQCDTEYTMDITLAKRAGLKNIKAVSVLEGDVFEFIVDTDTGRKKVTKHTQTMASLDKNIVVGAYAVCEMQDGVIDTTIMSIKQIEKAWQQGGSKGNSPAHRNFPDQMSEKTVIKRAVKLIIRGSDDANLFTDEEDKDTAGNAVANLNSAKETAKSNAEVISFEETPAKNEAQGSGFSAEEIAQIEKEEAELAQQQNGQTKAKF